MGFHMAILFLIRLLDIPFINSIALLLFLPSPFWQSLDAAWEYAAGHVPMSWCRDLWSFTNRCWCSLLRWQLSGCDDNNNSSPQAFPHKEECHLICNVWGSSRLDLSAHASDDEKTSGESKPSSKENTQTRSSNNNNNNTNNNSYLGEL
ncbi:unnamed protein product [Polarella glacialis]|uniref:Uncharacterized protein n=1 Tax=Polarella glacialis TaxID=89957 RepID=A0A813EA26_POLGL|nr:unnamed protein product [Polarella glacialis]